MNRSPVACMCSSVSSNAAMSTGAPAADGVLTVPSAGARDAPLGRNVRCCCVGRGDRLDHVEKATPASLSDRSAVLVPGSVTSDGRVPAVAAQAGGGMYRAPGSPPSGNCSVRSQLGSCFGVEDAPVARAEPYADSLDAVAGLMELLPASVVSRDCGGTLLLPPSLRRRANSITARRARSTTAAAATLPPTMAAVSTPLPSSTGT